MKYQVEFTDYRTGATSPIDVIEEEAGLTPEKYMELCKENADDEWNEMLEQGDVYLINLETYEIID